MPSFAFTPLTEGLSFCSHCRRRVGKLTPRVTARFTASRLTRFLTAIYLRRSQAFPPLSFGADAADDISPAAADARRRAELAATGMAASSGAHDRARHAWRGRDDARFAYAIFAQFVCHLLMLRAVASLIAARSMPAP